MGRRVRLSARSRPSSSDSRRSSPYVAPPLPQTQPRPFSPQVDTDAVMVPRQLNLFEDNSQLHLSQTTMHQQNLQVNQQANTQITNVFTDEASQLLTLQVTAAAATSVAEAQMQAQLQALAADSVVQLQNDALPN